HERQLSRDRAFPAALLTAAALYVEAESRGGVAALAGIGGLGEQRANRVVEADVGRGGRARGAADRRLVGVDHIADMFIAWEVVVGAGKDAAVVEERKETLVDDLVNERAFPGTRGASDAHELFERNLDIDVLEIVLAGAADDQRLASGPPAL